MHFSLEKAICLQQKLRRGIVLENRQQEALQRVAGVDLAYWKQAEQEYAVCCVVVLDRATKQVVEHQYAWGRIEIPYIPGCLAFRELPLVLKTVKKLEIEPDLYIFDGNGYLHPRHMGIATHASFDLRKPTIGVAKHYYKIGETDFIMPENQKFAFTDIVIKEEIYGRVLRTMKDVKPVFISVGNFIDLDQTTELVCEFVGQEGHIPLPTRLADIETHKMRKLIQSQQRVEKPI